MRHGGLPQNTIGFRDAGTPESRSAQIIGFILSSAFLSATHISFFCVFLCWASKGGCEVQKGPLEVKLSESTLRLQYVPDERGLLHFGVNATPAPEASDLTWRVQHHSDPGAVAATFKGGRISVDRDTATFTSSLGSARGIRVIFRKSREGWKLLLPDMTSPLYGLGLRETTVRVPEEPVACQDRFLLFSPTGTGFAGLFEGMASVSRPEPIGGWSVTVASTSFCGALFSFPSHTGLVSAYHRAFSSPVNGVLYGLEPSLRFGPGHSWKEVAQSLEQTEIHGLPCASITVHSPEGEVPDSLNAELLNRHVTLHLLSEAPKTPLEPLGSLSESMQERTAPVGRSLCRLQTSSLSKNPLGETGWVWRSDPNMPLDVYLDLMALDAFSPTLTASSCIENAPWTKGDAAVRRVRTLLWTRQSLSPYLQEAAQEALQGVPLARPLWWHFPGYSESYTCEQEYMLGTGLLIVPTGDSSRQRQAFFPSGGWNNFWEPLRIEGSGLFTVYGEPGMIPVFAREGVPIDILVGKTLRIGEPLGPEPCRAALLFPTDKGKTSQWRWECRGKTWKVWQAESWPGNLLLLGSSQPSRAWVDGRLLRHVTDPAKLTENAEGWSYISDSRLLAIKTPPSHRSKILLKGMGDRSVFTAFETPSEVSGEQETVSVGIATSSWSSASRMQVSCRYWDGVRKDVEVIREDQRWKASLPLPEGAQGGGYADVAVTFTSNSEDPGIQLTRRIEFHPILSLSNSQPRVLLSERGIMEVVLSKTSASQVHATLSVSPPPGMFVEDPRRIVMVSPENNELKFRFPFSVESGLSMGEHPVVIRAEMGRISLAEWTLLATRPFLWWWASGPQAPPLTEGAWKQVPVSAMGPEGSVDLGKVFPKGSEGCVYLMTRLVTEASRQALVAVESSSRFKLSLNNTVLIERTEATALSHLETVEATMEQGQNDLLVSVCPSRDSQRLWVRITDPDGSPTASWR